MILNFGSGKIKYWLVKPGTGHGFPESQPKPKGTHRIVMVDRTKVKK